MKKILMTLCVTAAMSFNASALTPKLSPAQQLAEIVDEHMLPFVISESNIKTSSQAILDYYQLEHTPANLQRVTKLVKDYYNSPEYLSKYNAQIASIYDKTMTPTEIQEWIHFFNSPVGVSVLKNKAYYESFNTLIEQLFPEDAEPSPEAQKKMIATMTQLSQ